MNKYQAMSDTQLNALAAKLSVDEMNMDEIIREVDVFVHVDMENDWQQVIVVDNKAAHIFSYEQTQEANDCLLQYLTEQQCVAMELNCRFLNAMASHDRKAY